MAVALTYPGVYVEELPSGVRTISGVATAVAAFIGRAQRGPVNEPISLSSFGDYERMFGGLWLESSMSYAVRDFFLNGGGQAIGIGGEHAFEQRCGLGFVAEAEQMQPLVGPQVERIGAQAPGRGELLGGL